MASMLTRSAIVAENYLLRSAPKVRRACRIERRCDFASIDVKTERVQWINSLLSGKEVDVTQIAKIIFN